MAQPDNDYLFDLDALLVREPYIAEYVRAEVGEFLPNRRATDPMLCIQVEIENLERNEDANRIETFPKKRGENTKIYHFSSACKAAGINRLSELTKQKYWRVQSRAISFGEDAEGKTIRAWYTAPLERISVAEAEDAKRKRDAEAEVLEDFVEDVTPDVVADLGDGELPIDDDYPSWWREIVFASGLANGSLSPKAFQRKLSQDAAVSANPDFRGAVDDGSYIGHLMKTGVLSLTSKGGVTIV